MIGRLPHPTNASRSIYVALLYRAASGDWQPLEDGFHATELAAFTACAKELAQRAIELNTRSDELQINLGRLLEQTGKEDIIHIGGMLHVLDANTGCLVPLGSPTPGIEENEPFEVVAEEEMGSLARAQEHTRMLLCAEKLEHSAALLRALAQDWKHATTGRRPTGDAGETA